MKLGSGTSVKVVSIGIIVALVAAIVIAIGSTADAQATPTSGKCKNGKVGPYFCHKMDLISHVPGDVMG